MVVMMDREISCKGHCEKLSHFLDHVSHTVNCCICHMVEAHITQYMKGPETDFLS